MTVAAVVFDFGGVLAEEGFREGLSAIARRSGLNPEAFYAAALEAVYSSGYVTGRAREADFWRTLRRDWDMFGDDRELQQAILSRFILRPGMIDIVRSLRSGGLRTMILSDQSDWLDYLDERDNFFKEFDLVLNSFHLGRTKRDISVFDDVVLALGVEAARILFVDDSLGHIERAAARGLQTHLFLGQKGFEDFLKIKKLL